VTTHNSTFLKLTVGNLTLDPQFGVVKRENEEIKLTTKEFKLLEYLMRSPGQVVTRENILELIWQYSPEIESRVVDVYMGYLRKKVEKQDQKKLLYTVRGNGYMIKE